MIVAHYTTATNPPKQNNTVHQIQLCGSPILMQRLQSSSPLVLVDCDKTHPRVIRDDTLPRVQGMQRWFGDGSSDSPTVNRILRISFSLFVRNSLVSNPDSLGPSAATFD